MSWGSGNPSSNGRSRLPASRMASPAQSYDVPGCDRDVCGVGHEAVLVVDGLPCWPATVSEPGTHVTHDIYQTALPTSAVSQHPPAPVTTLSRSSINRATQSCRNQQANTPTSCTRKRATKKVTSNAGRVRGSGASGPIPAGPRGLSAASHRPGRAGWTGPGAPGCRWQGPEARLRA